MSDQETGNTRRLIELGAEIAGSATGAAAGFVVAGPVGALGGAAVTPVLVACFKKLGHEVMSRLHSDREMIRAGATITIAAAEVYRRLQNGETPRSDDFFQGSPRDRSSAEEVLEGILVAAQRENQERKIPIYGHLYANIVFDQSVNRAHANYLIRLLDRLSYRQVCLLAEIGSIHSMTHIQDDARGDLVNELNELVTLGLVERELFTSGGSSAVYMPKEYGRRVHMLLGLALVDLNERKAAFNRESQ